MKKYNITVNGNTYEVEVEEVGSSSASTPVINTKKEIKTQAPKAEPSKKPAQKKAPSASGEKIEAPLSGTVFDIKVKEGGSVSKGDVILVLEAMKMENEIQAPSDGTVAEILVNVGDSVNGGDILVVLN